MHLPRDTSLPQKLLLCIYDFNSFDICCFLDMIAIPDFAAGAMENWGLITYRSSALLYDDVASGSKSKLRVASIVAHELAHQVYN